MHYGPRRPLKMRRLAPVVGAPLHGLGREQQVFEGSVGGIHSVDNGNRISQLAQEQASFGRLLRILFAHHIPAPRVAFGADRLLQPKVVVGRPGS